MPTAQRRASVGVIAELLQTPQQFSFFQAVRLLERWLAEGDGKGQGLSRLNFRNTLSLSFPASEIESLIVHRHGEGAGAARVPTGGGGLKPAEPVSALEAVRRASSVAADEVPGDVQSHEVARIDLTPAFMGLLGVSGALPLYYTETLAERELYHKDHAARAFMDVFSHRALALFYQAWRKHRMAVQYEGAQRQRFLPEVLALAGLGQRGLRERLAGMQGGVHDEALAFHAGTLQRRSLSARQMQQVLQSYLRVPVRIDQFVGRWYRLPEEARGHLGMIVGGRAGQVPTTGVLGQSAMLGERVWQRDLRMRVVLGPLNRATLQRFLPGGQGAAALKSWLTMLNGVALEYEINLTLQQDEVQGCTLSSSRTPQEARLGWDTFLQTRPADRDRSDVHYDIHAAA